MSDAWSACASAVVLVVDRLSPAFLGPYGNTWLETASCCRLASEGIMAETVIAHSPHLNDAYVAYWQGWNGVAKSYLRLFAGSSTPLADDFAFLQSIKANGRKTILLTDDPSVAQFSGASQFDECLLLEQPTVIQPAAEVEETNIAILLTEAMTLIGNQQGPFFLWIHARGMSGPWDAPPEFRNQFADEDDPLPGDFVQPPQQFVTKDIDPDELLAVQHAYAGQVSLLDVCIEGLLDAIQALPEDCQAFFALTSPRGYPLGEHGQIGTERNDLYSELIQLPLIVRHPQKYAQFARLQELLQPADLLTTLQESLGLASTQATAPSKGLLGMAIESEESRRAFAICQTAAQLAIRSPAWFLRQELASPLVPQTASDVELPEPIREELFVKPDDRFEVVEIASRMSHLPPQLVAGARGFLASLQSGKLDASSSEQPLLRDTWH